MQETELKLMPAERRILWWRDGLIAALNEADEDRNYCDQVGYSATTTLIRYGHLRGLLENGSPEAIATEFAEWWQACPGDVEHWIQCGRESEEARQFHDNLVIKGGCAQDSNFKLPPEYHVDRDGQNCRVPRHFLTVAERRRIGDELRRMGQANLAHAQELDQETDAVLRCNSPAV